MTIARLAVDIGGTFTDLALERDGHRTTAKTLTTPAAPEAGVLAGVRQILATAGLQPAEVGILIHGTTLATNAIIERKGAVTALVTTRASATCWRWAMRAGTTSTTCTSACRSRWSPATCAFPSRSGPTPPGASCCRWTRTPSAPWCRGCGRRACNRWRSVSCTPSPTRRTNGGPATSWNRRAFPSPSRRRCRRRCGSGNGSRPLPPTPTCNR